MYVEASDRQLIRRAIGPMSEMALDELSDSEIDGMYPENVTFIVAALRSMTNEMHVELPIVTENFNEYEVRRLKEILTGIEAILPATGIPAEIVSDNVELSEPEVKRLLTEQAELEERRFAVVQRIEEINRRLITSGESKYRKRTGREGLHGVQIGDGNQQTNVFGN